MFIDYLPWFYIAHPFYIIGFASNPCVKIPANDQLTIVLIQHEPRHDKTNKVTVRPAKTDQPRHPPSLIRVFDVCMKKRVLSYPLSAQRRLWSDWADAQADLSLRWAHSHIVGFVMSRFTCTRWLFSSQRKTNRRPYFANSKRTPKKPYY